MVKLLRKIEHFAARLNFSWHNRIFILGQAFAKKFLKRISISLATNSFWDILHSIFCKFWMENVPESETKIFSELYVSDSRVFRFHEFKNSIFHFRRCWWSRQCQLFLLVGDRSNHRRNHCCNCWSNKCMVFAHSLLTPFPPPKTIDNF